MKTRREARAWVLEATATSLRKHSTNEEFLPKGTTPAQKKRVTAEMLALAGQLERRLGKLKGDERGC